MVQSGAEVAGICATNDQLDESRPALTTRIKSRHESRSEIAGALPLGSRLHPLRLPWPLLSRASSTCGSPQPRFTATKARVYLRPRRRWTKSRHSPDPSAEIIFRLVSLGKSHWTSRCQRTG